MRPDRDRQAADAEAGFTLIEALIAMVVLTLLSAALLRGTVGVRSDAAWFDEHATATVLATTLLNDALADRALRNGTYHGEQNGRTYTLTASSADLDAQLPPARPDPAAAPPPNPNGVPGPAGAAPVMPHWRPQRIVVRVEAPNRPVMLETVRLADLR